MPLDLLYISGLTLGSIGIVAGLLYVSIRCLDAYRGWAAAIESRKEARERELYFEALIEEKRAMEYIALLRWSMDNCSII